MRLSAKDLQGFIDIEVTCRVVDESRKELIFLLGKCYK